MIIRKHDYDIEDNASGMTGNYIGLFYDMRGNEVRKKFASDSDAGEWYERELDAGRNFSLLSEGCGVK